MWGIHELSLTLKRHKQELGVSREDENLEPGDAGVLQAAWERAEMARTEIDKGFPLLNAQALVSMISALDALVEEWTPSLRAMRARWMAEQVIEKTNSKHADALDGLSAEHRENLEETLRTEVERKLGKVRRLKNKGVNRYEALLAEEGLGAASDRPIPADLDIALTEIGSLRDVLMHKGGRVDPMALKLAPTLRYQDGELVRISSDEFTTYSAAIRCYAFEIQFRPLRSWPEAADKMPDLENWRSYHVIGA